MSNFGLIRPLNENVPRLQPYRYGLHIGQTSNPLTLIREYLEQYKDYGVSTCQFYLGNQAKYNIPVPSLNDKSEIQRICFENIFTFYIHLPLVCNLANENNQKGISSSLSTIKQGIETVKDLPGSCVLHFGSPVSSSGTVESVASRINTLDIHPQTNNFYPPLLIENSAGEGRKLGSNWDDFRRLFEGLDNPARKIGICLDTQHSFGAGLCNWSDTRDCVLAFEEAESICKTGITLIHLNDSKVAFGSRKDQHQSLGKGYIFSNNRSLPALLEQTYNRFTDLVCETNSSCWTEDLNLIRNCRPL